MHFPHIGAVYISTEDVFPSKRLHQLTQCFSKDQASHPSAVKINFSDNVFIEHSADLVSPKINNINQLNNMALEIYLLSCNWFQNVNLRGIECNIRDFARLWDLGFKIWDQVFNTPKRKITWKRDFKTHLKDFQLSRSGQTFPRPTFWRYHSIPLNYMKFQCKLQLLNKLCYWPFGDSGGGGNRGGRGDEGMLAWDLQFKTKPFQLATQLVKKDLYMSICGSRHQKVKNCIPCVIETV